MYTNKILVLVMWFVLVCHAMNHPSTRVKSHRPPTFSEFCPMCNLEFHKEDAWSQHLAGNRHATNLKLWKSPEEVFAEFQTSAPHWADGCTVTDTAALFDMDKELSSPALGLKFRSGQTLHPSGMIESCSPYTKARVWRYLRHAIGPGHSSHYKEIATILAHVESQPCGFLRIKEIFESIESFRLIENFILAAQRTRKAQGLPPLNRIVELATGHGLVGVLLAYRFGVGANPLHVSMYDLQRRPYFDLLLQAFERHGETNSPESSSVLPNLEFHEADLSLAATEIDDCSVVVSIHGCNEVNRDTIEMASRKHAVWCVIPCCIRADMYTGSACVVNLREDERDVRHSILCGFMAQRYGAQLVQEIDRRITNRAIFIGGGVGVEEGEGGLGTNGDRSREKLGGYRKGELGMSASKGHMPRLLLS
jgi:hypothetical protein